MWKVIKIRKHCIYKIQNKLNGKTYIGQTVDYRKRMNGHKSRSRQVIDKAIDKYGWDNFNKEILINGLSSEEADNWEMYLINEVYNSYKGVGYNCGEGGEGKHWLGKELPQYIKDKISKAQSGKNSAWYGRKHTEEDKNKIRMAHSKLNKDGYLKIYNEFKNTKINQKNLAKKYNLGESTIARIVKAKHWATKELDELQSEGFTGFKGEDHPKSKYDNETYVEIFNEYWNTSKSYNDLANKYNLNKSTIARIVKSKHSATKHLKGGE